MLNEHFRKDFVCAKISSHELFQSYISLSLKDLQQFLWKNRDNKIVVFFSPVIGKLRHIFVLPIIGGGAAYLPPPQFADGSNGGGDRGDFSADSSGGSLLGVSAATLVTSGPNRRCQNSASDTQPLLLASSFRHPPVTSQRLMRMRVHVENIWFGNIAFTTIT
jgi:hypothetical protein